MVKHANLHTCESALYYQEDRQIIAQECEFEFFYNISVPPNVPDGGDEIVLVNVRPQKNLKCLTQIQNSLPQGNYIKTNRSVLCHCSIEGHNSCISSDIGSCYNSPNPPTFEYTQNIAFLETFKQISLKIPNMKDNVKIFTDFINTNETLMRPPVPYPVSLNESNFNGHISNLKDLSKKFKHHIDMIPITPNHSRKLKRIIDGYIEEHSRMSVTQTKVTLTASVITIGLLVPYVIWLTMKYNKLHQMVKALSVGGIPLAHAQTVETTDTVTCQNTWISFIFFLVSALALLLYLYRTFQKPDLM